MLRGVFRLNHFLLQIIHIAYSNSLQLLKVIFASKVPLHKLGHHSLKRKYLPKTGGYFCFNDLSQLNYRFMIDFCQIKRSLQCIFHPQDLDLHPLCSSISGDKQVILFEYLRIILGGQKRNDHKNLRKVPKCGNFIHPYVTGVFLSVSRKTPSKHPADAFWAG